MFYKTNEELGFDDVSIAPAYSTIKSRAEVNPFVNYGPMKDCTPYMITNMSSVGNIKSAKFLNSRKVPVAIHKYVDTKELCDHLNTPESERTIISVGLDEHSQKHLPLLKLCPRLLIDVPNGYIEVFYNLVKKVRQEYPDAWIMAGNVIDVEAFDHLSFIGINCVRLGIGGGSVCRTSNKTGVGRKSITAIQECFSLTQVELGGKIAQINTKICWDGGVRSSSDICKALHAGANYVCVGRMFAGYKEINQNLPVKRIRDMMFGSMESKLPYYGMSSEEANNKYCGGLKEYRAAEGITEYLSIQENPDALIKDIEGSIRSYMTYTGKSSL